MNTFDEAVASLLVTICADFNKAGFTHCKIWEPKDFDWSQGRKYAKLIRTDEEGRMQIWGFIVRKTDAKWVVGDILKPASRMAPALNHARGNIFHNPQGITWTGPTYCGTDSQKLNETEKELRDTVKELTEI